MDFRITDQQEHLRQRCLALATDFATRAAEHDRDASHPTENYDRLRAEGFLALTIAPAFGGLGFDFLSHTLAYEALGQGCPATALAFNMHASVVMPLLVPPDAPGRSVEPQLGCAGHAGDTQRSAGARQLPRGRQRGVVSVR